jgi:hypothetical protein
VSLVCISEIVDRLSSTTTVSPVGSIFPSKPYSVDIFALEGISAQDGILLIAGHNAAPVMLINTVT